MPARGIAEGLEGWHLHIVRVDGVAGLGAAMPDVGTGGRKGGLSKIDPPHRNKPGLRPRVSTQAQSLAYPGGLSARSEEHTSELQSLMRISYAVFCLKKKKIITNTKQITNTKTQARHTK